VVEQIETKMRRLSWDGVAAYPGLLREWADRLRDALKAEPGTRHISGGVCLSCGRLMEAERPKSFDDLPTNTKGEILHDFECDP
jgi:hypothetical protein